ncbi:MAG TPA: FAD-binding protein, partial [Zoogloea sp.]|nr:FAD-binding protein [Zoogloea sp.]
MPALPAPLVQQLTERFGKRFSTAEAVRAHHGHDESHFPDALPDGVVWPHSTAEVVEVVKLCREHRVPLIPFGVGSSLEGHILATRGGLSLDMSEMNQVLAIHNEDMDAVVQPGVTR